MDDIGDAGEVAAAAMTRSRQLIEALEHLDQAALDAPSELPDWSRLTIVCHLRYGARALLRMTLDALAGRETSYYPRGRAVQRPVTLRPSPGEPPARMIDDWRSAVGQLDLEWSTLTEAQWRTPVVEPANNVDLGPMPLAQLALALLTEVDVHGTDLGIGAPDWSQTLVQVALPTRLMRLSTRRTNHRAFDASIAGTWRLEATEGLKWLIAVDGDRVTSRRALTTDQATATISASGRDLLALLLGRPCRDEPVLDGDLEFARSFQRAFPGP